MVGFAAFMAMAIDCGLGTIGVRRIAAARAMLPSVAALVPLARLALAVVAIPVMIICVETLGPAPMPRGLVWLYATSLVFVALNQEWLLQSAGLMAQVAVAQLLRMLTFAAIVLWLVHGSADASLVGLAEIAAAVVVSLYYLGQQQARITPVRASFAWRGAMDLMREAASLGLSQFAWAAAQFMPLFLIGSSGSNAATVAWFAAAQRLVTSLLTFSYVYHFNLYPVLARAAATSATAFADLMRASFRATAWFSIGGALALTLVAAPLLSLIFGTRFEVAAPALAVLGWVIPITFLSGHARWSLVVAGAHGRVLAAQLGGLAAVVLSGIPLIATMGERGAAAAAVVGSIAVWALSHHFAARVSGPPPRFSLAMRPLVLAVIAGGLAGALDFHVLLRAAVGVSLYAALAPLVDRALVADLVLLAHAKASAPSKPAT